MGGDQEESRKLLTRLGVNAREMMQSMDDIVWAIDPAHDDLEHVVTRMRAYALPILEARSIQLLMHLDAHANSIKLDMLKRKNLFLIFKEAINNIAKYSEATVADVSITREGKKLIMKVRDNGKGFDTAALSERHGLKNMKARAEEAGGSCAINSVASQGTEVAVVIGL
jgi:signal transduction histidine kinase